MLPALVVFAFTYVAISSGGLPGFRLDRTTAALLGACGMVLVRALTVREAYEALNFDTIVLLFGMLAISAVLAEAGFFRAAASATLRRGATPKRLLVALVIVAGGLSAILVNDTICIMFTPLVVAVVEEAGLEPLPFLLALTTSTNIGGVVSFTGNPQNMIVGTASGIPFGAYLLRMLPVGVLGLALDALLLCHLFRTELSARPLDRKVAPPALDRDLAGLGLLTLAAVVAAFFAGRSLPGTAVTGGAVLFAAAAWRSRRSAPGAPSTRPIEGVSFSLLVFFAGLFVVVAGLGRGGGLDAALAFLAPRLGHGRMTPLALFAGITVVGSNLVSNVPFVMIAQKLVPVLALPRQGWMVLAMASTLAGNLTIFGSVANLIVLESAGRHGRVGFFRFLRVGVVVTGATLALGLAVIALELHFGLG